MNMLAQPLRLTAEEFEKIADHKGIELIDGVVKEKGMGTEAGAIGGRVARHLGVAADADDLGEVVINDGMYRCFPNKPNRVRKPDVSFLLRTRLPNGEVPTGITVLRPDIAVEVVSPNNEYEEVDERVADYFSAGVPLVWVVCPATRTVL
ncbi:MAG TPA: Uma2 family endonuclease, partial [Urbifossiella sp.]|nr:Uma2 family endonuclease [Urbifossiella sp.]